MTDNPIFHSSISFDLGARNTGIFITNHPADTLPQSEHTQACTIVQPVEGDGFVYSTTNRTSVRHRLRNGKRFKLARRLVHQVIDALRKNQPDVLPDAQMRATLEAVSTLLKRRGFSRIESDSDIDVTVLDDVDAAVFADHEDLGRFFSADTPISAQWSQLSQNTRTVEELLKALPSQKEFVSYLKNTFPELVDQKKLYESALKVILTDVKSIQLQLGLGHKHRTKYFEAIGHDMHRDSRLKPVFALFGSEERFKTFICNISNLQLRALRWYFDEPNADLADRWNADKFRAVWVRSLKYFHPEEDRKADLHQLIGEIEASEDVLGTLCGTDPVRTIPCYEDQNNRRPPNDQTLWLSAAELNRRFGSKWLIWSQRFEHADPTLADGLDEILVFTDRRSRVFGGNDSLPATTYAASYVLQRVLDRNSRRDIYALRALAAGHRSQELTEALQNLTRTLGTQHVETFLAFAAEYYEEVQASKNGLWLEGLERLLERADIHPPMKKKVIDLLVGNLLDSTPEVAKKLRTELWNRPVHDKSRSTPSSLCRAIEVTRKDFGGEFRMRYDDFARRRQAADAQNVKFKPSNAEDKALLKIWNAVQTMRAFLANVLQLTPQQLERTKSPFVFAQLHTLIDTERDGFTSTSLAAHLENHWRMRSDELGAQCSRLPADSVRPFDGVLAKALDRQAWESAKIAAQALMSQKDLLNTDIRYSIIIESNRFAFSASIADLKKNTATKKNAEAGQTLQLKRWQDKESRIRAASAGLCAYTGEPLTDVVEYDHIIPRAFTTAAMGTIFNSEANLICVSRRGNQLKADKRYELSNLHKNYLNAVFGSSDIDTVTSIIEDEVSRLVKSNRLRYFELLSDKEQNAVRHALFLSDGSAARRAVLRELAATNRTRVNGTQAWFVRCFMTKLLSITEDWRTSSGCTLDIRSWKTDAEVASRLRSALAEINPVFKKTQPQPVASHTIDAMCAYATACGLPGACEHLGANPSFADEETFDQKDSLAALHPLSVDLISVRARELAQKDRPDSRAIFKEGIYAEHFLPLILMKDRLFVGFELPKKDGTGGNALEFAGKSPLSVLTLLSTFLDREPVAFSDHPTCYRIVPHRAFELLTKCVLTPEKATEEEKQQAELLRGLCFRTSRIPVMSRLIDAKNKYVAQKDALKNDDFVIKVKLGSRKLGFSAAGQLVLPAKGDWAALVSAPELQAKWTQPADDFLEGWLQRRMNMNSSKRKHVSLKRVASLPVCDSPSGGFRIRRENFDKTPIYQVHAFASAKYFAFRSDEHGNVRWNDPVIAPHLHHDNLVPVDQETVSAEHSVAMSEWRTVETTSEVSVSVCPATRQRRYVRVELPFETLRTWLSAGGVAEVPTTPMHLPQSIALPDPKTFSAEAQKTVTIFAQPRAKIFFEKLGDRVTFRFEASGGPAAMNAAYNKAGNA